MWSRALILFFICSVAWAQECTKVEISVLDVTEIKSVADVCLQESFNQGEYVASQECIKRGCHRRSFYPPKKIQLTSLPQAVGSPGFTLCRLLKGQPQFYKYKTPKSADWTSDSRCLFEHGMFLSNTMLLSLFKDSQ